jgi:hypothetical protein
MPLQEHRVREAVTGHVLDRHGVPAAMLDGDPGLVSHRSNRTSTSVSMSGAKLAWRQPNTSRWPGSQTRTGPISNTLPDGRRSTSRVPSPAPRTPARPASAA